MTAYRCWQLLLAVVDDSHMTPMSLIRYVRGAMRLKAKCIEKTCSDYGREQIIDVTSLLRLLAKATGL